MSKKSIWTQTITILLLCVVVDNGFGGDWKFGLGVNGGVSRLEGDLRNSKISPIASAHFIAAPIPFFALVTEVGFSPLNSSSPQLAPALVGLQNFRTTAVPFELSGRFNLLPLKSVNPYIFIGGGGVYWKATADVIVTGNNATIGDGVTGFIKTGGGIEFNVSPNFSLNMGGSFRYALIDNFDGLSQGDENDQILDAYAGFTYYFNQNRGDLDHDYIPDELDLMPEIAEDRDGYLDHDGIPEKNADPASGVFENANGSSSPVVVHNLLTSAEAGKDALVKAFVYSNRQLRVVAVLYRPNGTRQWNVVRLESLGGELYEGHVPGYAVTKDGFQYCVVAVDESLSGIGYSGLPSKPINVKVSPSGTPWRIIGGLTGAAAIGAATYIVIRKQ